MIIMKIKSLKMENYRPYRKPFEINFAYGDEAHDGKNLTIIVGGNDFGKTNFLNAVSWCIYGEEPYKDSTKDVYNQSAAKDLPVGRKLEVYVEVIMENNEGDDILLRRSQKFKKGNSGRLRKVSDPVFIINNLSDKDNYKIMDCDSFRKTNFPDGLQQYFLFDGERLLEWLKSDSGSLKTAVEKLSHFDLILKAKKNTSKQISNLTVELTDLNYKKGELKSKQLQLNRNIQEDENELKKVRKSIKSLEGEKTDLEFVIYRKGGDKTKDLKKDIDILEKDLNRYRNSLTDLQNEKLQYLIENFYIILGYPFLKNVSLINEEFKKNRPPVEHDYKISVEDIDFLLSKKECICGNHLVEENGSINNLKLFKDKLSKLTSKTPEEIELDILQDKSSELIKKFPKDYNEKIFSYLQEITNLEDIIKEKEDILADKEDEYNVLLEAKIPEKIKELNRCEQSLTNLRIRENALETNIKEAKEELQGVNNDLIIDESKDDAVNKVESKIRFCERIISICEELENKFAKLIYKELDHIVNEEFQNIYNREGDRGKYEKIHIDESLEITFEEFDGVTSSSSDPSSGTQLALAVSFITAINLSSGFQLPQIMDTSLGRWDNTLRRNFALTLPKYLENVQMVFLFLDSEFNDEFEELIQDYIGEKHILIRENNNETLLDPNGGLDG